MKRGKRILALCLALVLLLGTMPAMAATGTTGTQPASGDTPYGYLDLVNMGGALYKITFTAYGGRHNNAASGVMGLQTIVTYDNTKIKATTYDPGYGDKAYAITGAYADGEGHPVRYSEPTTYEVTTAGNYSTKKLDLYAATIADKYKAAQQMYELYVAIADINALDANSIKLDSASMVVTSNAGDQANPEYKYDESNTVTENQLTVVYSAATAHDKKITLAAPTVTLTPAAAGTGGLSGSITAVADTTGVASYSVQMYDAAGTTAQGNPISVATDNVAFAIPESQAIVAGTSYTAKVKAVAAADGLYADSPESAACTAVVAGKSTSKVTTVTITGGADAITVPTGDTAATTTFTAKVVDQYGVEMNPTIDWTITPEITGVSITDGIVSVTNAAKAAITDATGTALTVTAKVQGKEVQGTATITVKRAAQTPTTVEITGENAITVPTLAENALEKTYTATVKDQYGVEMTGDGAKVTWSGTTPAPAGVSIDQTTGVVSVTNAADPTGAGVAYEVKATCGTATATKAITIKRATAAATTVQVKRGETVLTATDTIVIPVAGAAVYTYSAVLLDQYGADMEGTIAWTASTQLPAGVTVAGATVTVASTTVDAGQFTLTATAGGKATTIAITAKKIAVDWDAKVTQGTNPTITYGDAKSKAFTNNFPATGTAKAGETKLDGTFSIVDDTAILAAGDAQPITVQFKVTTAGDYVGTVITKDYNVKVNPKPITVTMDNKTKAYGAENPALDFTVPTGALVGTDTVDVLAITGACAATTTSPAGTPVDITGISAATNYTVTVNKGVLTITPATITGIATAAPAHTVLANDAANTDPAALTALKAIANAGAALPATVTVSYGTSSTAELGITWANATEPFNIKGGVYTYKGTVTPGTNFAAYATTLDAKVTVTPVNGTISKVDGADASALATPVTVAKAKASAAANYAALKLPASIELTFDGGVAAATYNNLTFSVPLATLKAAAVDSTTKVTVTSIPAWVTIDPANLAVDVKITAKYPVNVTVTPPTGVTYGTALGDPTPVQVEDQDGTDTGTVTWTYLYEGTTTAGVAYSSAEKPTQAGTYTVTATLVSTTHAGSQKSATFTITKKPLASSMIAVTGTYTYTGKPIIPTYTVADGKLLNASDYKAAITDNTNAGTAKITITAEAKGNYKDAAAKTFAIAKASLAALTPTITGTAQVGKVLTANLSGVADSELTWQWMRADVNIDGATGKTYTITAADSNKAITVKAAGASAGNYTGDSLASTAVTVAKMAISGAVSIAITNGTSADAAKVDATDTLTATITAILPTEAQAGATYQWYRNGTAIDKATKAAYTVTAEDAAAVLKVVVTPAANFTGTAKASVEVGKTALTGTLALSGDTAVGQTLTATYSDAGLTLNADYTITWMRNGTVIPGAGTMTYVITAADQGKSITAVVVGKGTFTGTILATAKAIPAAKPAAPAVTASAGDKQVTFSWTAPADNGAPITGYVITIGKAAVTVGPNVLTYTATGLTNGTVCTATVVAINSVGTGATGTATATPKAPVTPPTPTPPPTPDDGGNTGNGGNGSEASTGNKTETVQNADGSTTITVTNQASGTVTETTQRKDGSKTVVETKKDGTVTTTDTLKNGVKSTTVSTPDGTTTATVDLPAGVEIARIALPVEGANAGTVVVLVHADGTRELIRKSMVKDGKLLFTLDADAKLEIRDNAKSFPDTQHHWANQAIAFVTAHELFSGVTDKKFDPNRDMNRAMLVTVLYRLEGTPKAGAASFADVPQDSYYASAAAWAMENGILLGNAKGDLDPDSSITREAMVTLLYRYAKGSPAAEGLGGFNDTGAVSDFAKEAMSWGVANGIINGKAGGKLDPKGTATRGEVATMLQRFVEQLVK